MLKIRRISERESELPKTFLGQLQKIASEDKSVISLSIGEPDFITPKPILQHIQKLVSKVKANRMTHYTSAQGLPELREAIAKKLKKENRINANPGNIIIGAGSQELFFTALLATIDPTEEVILSSPGYMGYMPAIYLVEGVPKFFQLKQENNFEINPDEIKKQITSKTEAIIINTPSNPTGNVLSRKTLEEIAKIAVDNDLFIFSDEAYEHIIYNKPHISIGSLNGMHNYVASFYTFSKSYAMCGFRVGYAHGPNELIQAMTKSIHYITLCPPHISQLLALKALQIPKTHIEKMRAEYQKRRNFIVSRLNEIGLKTAMPNGAFYAFADIKSTGMSSEKFTNHLLSNAKVAVIPGSEFGPYGEGFARFSYANSMENIKTAMHKIEKVL